MITVPPAPAEHGPEVAVDRLHHPEGDLLVAVAQDPVQVAGQEPAELAEGRQPLPAQGPEPALQEPPGGPLVGGGPEAGQLLLQEVGLGQPAVEGEALPEARPFVSLQIGPPPQEQPALAAGQTPSFTPLPEELGPPDLVQRLGGVAQDVELVVDDPGVGQMSPEALDEGLPHVHADSADGPAAAGRQGLGEEAVQGLPFALQPHPEGFAALHVADHGQERVALAQGALIDPEVS